MSRLLLVLLTFAAAMPFRLAGAQDKSPTKGETTRAESAQRDTGAGNYVLQPLDLIKITIYGEAELGGDRRVSQEGKVNLPLVGLLDLKGKTVADAEDLIRKRYDADFLVKPQVNITVVEYAPRSVEIFGQVTNPGLVYFPKEEGMTLTRAISLAGSFTRLANRKEVVLKRVIDGKIQTWTINCDELTKGKSDDAWPLQHGDVITVPERII